MSVGTEKLGKQYTQFNLLKLIMFILKREIIRTPVFRQIQLFLYLTYYARIFLYFSTLLCR